MSIKNTVLNTCRFAFRATVEILMKKFDAPFLKEKGKNFPNVPCLRQLCPQSHPARKRASTFSMLSPGGSGEEI